MEKRFREREIKDIRRTWERLQEVATDLKAWQELFEGLCPSSGWGGGVDGE